MPWNDKVTYSELLLSQTRKENAIRDYKRNFYNYLFTCLVEAGYVGKLVRVKSIDKIGVLRVEFQGYSAINPYKITFYPLRKDGGVSMRSTYVPLVNYKIEEVPKQLKELFEVVGDFNEG